MSTALAGTRSAAELAPVGRLAPSPTGLLHLGHARTFLVAYWSARSREGQVRLRFDDLDGDRVEPRFVDAALRDLGWLGIDWDGPPIFESGKQEVFADAVRTLLERGLAYPCVCTRGELATAGQAPHGTGELRYPGTCRGRFATLAQAERQSGRPAGVRLLVPEGPLEIDDAVAGPTSFDVAREAGDFLIARRNGAPAYQLACAIGDTLDGISEVLRGDDLLPSAARQAHVQRSLARSRPRYAHVPLVVDAGGRRLAKRAGDLALAELRERGVDPRAIVAWAARSAGVDAGERVLPGEVSPHFRLERLPRAAVAIGPRLIEALLAAAR